MKKLLSVFCLLLILAACGDDGDKVNVYPGGYRIKNAEGLDWNNVSANTIGDSTWLCGLKNWKIWIGLFDEQTKEQLEEWNGIETIPENLVAIKSLDVQQSGNYTVCQVYFSDDMYSTKILVMQKNHEMVETDIFNSYTLQGIFGNTIFTGNYFGGLLYSFDGNVVAEGVYGGTIDDSTFLLSGFKNEKAWFGLYDSEHNQLEEWFSANVFERKIKQHVGYGEYVEYYVNGLGLMDYLKTDWGYVITSTYNDDHGTRASGLVFFLNNGIVFSSPMETKDVSKMRNWYNNSVCIKGIGYKVLSPNGELLAEFDDDYMDNEVEPVSYTETVGFFSKSLSRYDHKEKKLIWETEIDRLNTIQSDTKVTVTLVEKNKHIWLYHCDILNYAGSEQQFNLSIDIETGKLDYI